MSHPDPRLVAGTLVRLVGKPAQARRVIKSEWHSHQRVYVYIIETTAPTPFEPYWFAEQLEVVEWYDIREMCDGRRVRRRPVIGQPQGANTRTHRL